MSAKAEVLEEEPSDRKSAALALAERGFFILAVDPKDKRPDRLLAPNGFKGATRDPETIAGWFDAKPRCNVGIAVSYTHLDVYKRQFLYRATTRSVRASRSTSPHVSASSSDSRSPVSSPVAIRAW